MSKVENLAHLGKWLALWMSIVGIYETPLAFCSEHDENRASDDG
jgi:hypothetical protein